MIPFPFLWNIGGDLSFLSRKTKKVKRELGVVAHACNSSYTSGNNGRIVV
jgi:hypothetical protein